MKKQITISVALVVAALLVIMAMDKVGFLKKGSSVNNSDTSVSDYKDGTYIIDGRSVTLVDGKSEVEVAPDSASKIITQYFGNESRGYVNGDKTEDVAFLLTENNGGSGTFYYVVVAEKIGNGYVGTNAILLGDRIAPQTTEVRNGLVIVNYADRGPEEPMATAPSFGKSKYLALEAGKLVEVPVVVESPVRGGVVSSPLTVRGLARGFWFFEATLPLVLLDGERNVVAEGYAQAEGEWMTTEYVRFSGTLEFKNKPSGEYGTLVVKRDNPSGLPEHDDSREFPVSFNVK